MTNEPEGTQSEHHMTLQGCLDAAQEAGEEMAKELEDLRNANRVLTDKLDRLQKLMADMPQAIAERLG